MNKTNLTLFTILVSLGCRTEEKNYSPLFCYTEAYEPYCDTDQNMTGIADEGNDGIGNEGVDDTSGPSCMDDPDFGEFRCRGLAYGVYCAANNPTNCIMEVTGAFTNTGRKGVCVGFSAQPNAPIYSIKAPIACGVWAGNEVDYNDYDTPIANDLEAECRAQCEANLTEGAPFPASFVSTPPGGSATTWNFSHADCFFGDQYGDFTSGYTKQISNGVGMGDVFANCQNTGISGPPYIPPESFVGVGCLGPGGVGMICPCSTNSCLVLECDDYDYGVGANVGVDSQDRTTIKSHIDLSFRSQLNADASMMMCGEGRYVWSEEGVTRNRFDGLGAGELYYRLGFRNGDRLLTMSKYNPTTFAQIGPSYPLDTPAEMMAAYDALLTGTGSLYIKTTFRRSGGTWTIFIKSE